MFLMDIHVLIWDVCIFCTMDKETCRDPKVPFPSWYGSFEQSNDYSSISDDCGSIYFEKYKRHMKHSVQFHSSLVRPNPTSFIFPKVRYTLRTRLLFVGKQKEFTFEQHPNDPLVRCHKWVHIMN